MWAGGNPSLSRICRTALARPPKDEARRGVTDDRDSQRRRLQRGRKFLDQAARALVGYLGAIGKHRPPVLIDDFEVEALTGLLKHDVF